MKAPNSWVKPIEVEATNRLISENYGLFVHFVPELSIDSKGRPLDTEACLQFNVDDFVSDLKRFKIEYLRFTAWHKNMIPLYPSMVMKQWRGDHAFFKRDLIGEIIQAVKPLGIKIQLYTHPRDGHDFSADDQVQTGWGAGAKELNPNPDPQLFDFSKWNDFICEAYSELLRNYGGEISAIYLDEGSEQGDSEWVVDYSRLRKVIKSHAPDARIIQNYYGNLYSSDMGDHEYGRWGEFANLNGNNWPTYMCQSVSAVVGSTWWAATAAANFEPGYSAVDLYRYLVMQIATSKIGGGLALAAGPYCEGGWEPGVSPLLEEVADYITKYAQGIFGVRASEKWACSHAEKYSTLTWGVAVDSGSDTFIHVLKWPENSRLNLPAPADGSIVAKVTSARDDKIVPFSINENGGVEMELSDLRQVAIDTLLKVSFLERGAGWKHF
jgi:alpha-L-fucosidase